MRLTLRDSLLQQNSYSLVDLPPVPYSGPSPFAPAPTDTKIFASQMDLLPPIDQRISNLERGVSDVFEARGRRAVRVRMPFLRRALTSWTGSRCDTARSRPLASFEPVSQLPALPGQPRRHVVLRGPDTRRIHLPVDGTVVVEHQAESKSRAEALAQPRRLHLLKSPGLAQLKACTTQACTPSTLPFLGTIDSTGIRIEQTYFIS
jgi:hypothetical protein